MTREEEFVVTTRPDRVPTHPRELLREIIEEHLDLSISEAGRRLNVSRQTLHAILSGEAAVTTETALLFGKSPDLWVKQREMADELARIETVVAA